MKNRITTLFLGLILSICLAFPAFAEAQLPYVTDTAGLLSEDEILDLEAKSKEISDQYDFGIYIITVDDAYEYVEAPDMDTVAETFYLNYELGEGDDQSGLLLMLSMEERDWAMFAFGYGNTAFTDYGKQYLADHFLSSFGDDNWYQGFVDYEDTAKNMLEEAVNGSPVDVGNEPEPGWFRILGIIACALIAAGIAFFVKVYFETQLESVFEGDNAAAFVTDGGLKLTEHYDHYTHTTQSRVYDPPKEDNSSSGGTSTRSSGGSSSSGKF